MSDYFITSNGVEPFRSVEVLLNSAKDDLVIFSPYIITSQLEALILRAKARVTIITSWKVRDLWLGVSDLALYDLSKKLKFRVYINNQIHLKAYIQDWETCIIGSANLTGRGLGSSSNFNYELCRSVKEIPQETQLYFRSIIDQSFLLNESIYNEFLTKVKSLPRPPELGEVDISTVSPDKDFLISALPMSSDIELLYSIYSGSNNDASKEQKLCAYHDMTLYSLPPQLAHDAFVALLESHFFSSSFIGAFIDFLADGKYFGEVKAWIQNSCTDVPVPSRRDLTGNIQVLYHWFVSLKPDQFGIERPNHSERLYRK